MARINSYTGEVTSEETAIREDDGSFVVPIEAAVLEAVGVDPGEPIVVKGSIGGKQLRIEAVDGQATDGE